MEKNMVSTRRHWTKPACCILSPDSALVRKAASSDPAFAAALRCRRDPGDEVVVEHGLSNY